MSSVKRALLSVLGSRLIPLGWVDHVEVVSDHFRLIEITSDAFKDAVFEPAANFRFNVGDWQMRTYTPLTVDGTRGRVRILAYLHGEGAGSRWAKSVTRGDMVHALGPQKSLDLLDLSDQIIFFGDETSFTAAETLQDHRGAAAEFANFFEVTSLIEAHNVADHLGLSSVRCFERNEAHLPLVVQAIEHALDVSAGPCHVVLTGNGHSIQVLRAALRTRTSSNIDYRVKAYWAPGKSGLE